MAEWVTPIVDRTEADTVEAFNNQMIEAHLKGALNYSDLNRIENNFKYLVDNLAKQGYYINHKYRNYTEREAVVTKIEIPGKPGSGGNIVEPWIQSSGTQFIDTGFKPNNNTRAVLDCEITYGSTWTTIFGSYSSSNFFSWWANGNAIEADYANGGKIVTSSASGRITLDANKNVWSVNQNSVTFTNTSFNSTLNAYIFTVNGGTASIEKVKMKLYSCQIYDNDVLVRDFIPTLDDNNVACLYDKVEGKYYYNAGSGSFTYGEDVYTPVEYIESSSGTQYINTRFKHNQNTRVVMHVKPTSVTANAWLFEGRASQGSSISKGVFFFYSNDKKWNVDYTTTRSAFSGISATDELFVDYNKNVCTINGISITNTPTTFQSTSDLVLLADNSGGTISGYIKAKLYSCQIYDNDVLIRDFIPVVDASGVALLYDQLNGVPYYNAGSGSFAFKRLPGEVEYIESSGTQYINTSYYLKSQNLALECDFSIANMSGVVPFGGGSANQYLPSFHQTGAGATPCFWIGSSGYLCPISIKSNERTLVSVNANNGKLTATNGETTATASYSGSMSTSYPFLIFAQQDTNGATQFASMKLYGFKMYDNDVLVRDYVPYVDENGVVCLFDKVSQTYFYNKGSGTFNAGAPIAKDDGDVEYEYIVEYIDQLYTEWFEQNLPWKSEIDRIRRNFNNLLKEYLYGKRISQVPYTQYFKFTEANKLEDISASTKQTLENMIAEYRYCGTVNSGGDRLL